MSREVESKLFISLQRQEPASPSEAVSSRICAEKRGRGLMSRDSQSIQTTSPPFKDQLLKK